MHFESTSEMSRAAFRRRQVLEAAAGCFRQGGFHGASIAQIAMEAGMSVGHIYRYFTNKEDIIANIFRQELAQMRAMIGDVADPLDVRASLAGWGDRCIDQALDPDHVALAIEIKAEAARNENLAAAMRITDAETRMHMRRLIAEAMPDDCTEADLAMRAEMLSLVFEGLPLRAISNPDLDREAMIQIVRMVIGCALREPFRARPDDGRAEAASLPLLGSDEII